MTYGTFWLRAFWGIWGILAEGTVTLVFLAEGRALLEFGSGRFWSGGISQDIYVGAYE